MRSLAEWPGAVAAAVAEWTDRKLEWLAGLTLTAGVFLTALLGVWIVSSGVPTVRGVDLNVILTMQKALDGLPLYTDTAAPPFDVAQYSPLFYLLTMSVSRLFGLGADSPATLLALARTISVLSGLAALWLQVRFATESLGIPRRLALGAAGFAVVATAPWLFMARPDAMALFIQLAAFVLMAASARSADGGRLCILAALVAAAALFTKQSAIQVLPIALMFYALLGRWTLAALFATAFAAAAGTAWWLSTWWWPHFAANVIGGVDNGISLFHAFDNTYSDFFPLYAPLLALVLLGLIRWVRRPLTWDAAFFLAVLTGLLAVATVTALKRGSAANYYNEFLFVAAIAAAKLLHESRAGTDVAPELARLAPPRAAAALLICWLPFHVVMELRDSWWKRVDPRIALMTPVFSLWSDDYAELRALAATVDADRRVLAFPLAANTAFPAAMLVPQKEIAHQLFERRIVDYAAFEALVRRNELALIVTTADEQEPPRSFLGVLMPASTPIATNGSFRVFRVIQP
jgi:hypothetical protein